MAWYYTRCWTFMFKLSSVSNDKELEWEIWAAPTQNSRIWPLGCRLCGSGGSIYNNDTKQNTLSAWTHNDRSINIPKGGLKLLKLRISQYHSSRIYFITPGWRVTRNLNLLSLTISEGANSNVTSNKCVCMTTMVLMPN
jgi:hypothetical protein